MCDMNVQWRLSWKEGSRKNKNKFCMKNTNSVNANEKELIFKRHLCISSWVAEYWNDRSQVLELPQALHAGKRKKLRSMLARGRPCLRTTVDRLAGEGVVDTMGWTGSHLDWKHSAMHAHGFWLRSGPQTQTEWHQWISFFLFPSWTLNKSPFSGFHY